MRIDNLENTSIETIVETLLDAFSNYFVPFPKEVLFWKLRFETARVDYRHSYGCFEGGRLVAFIINAIDKEQGMLTAFNTGTGVITDYRGQGLVDKMYDYSFPKLKAFGVQQYKLEVIQENYRAIRVYERIGFSIDRQLNGYKGTLHTIPHTVELRSIEFEEIIKRNFPEQQYYSWDNSFLSVQKARAAYQTYSVLDKAGKELGYFVINPSNGYIAQLSSFVPDYSFLLAGVQQISPQIKINNVDTRRTALVQALQKAGLENTINQHEMLMKTA